MFSDILGIGYGGSLMQGFQCASVFLALALAIHDDCKTATIHALIYDNEVLSLLHSQYLDAESYLVQISQGSIESTHNM